MDEPTDAAPEPDDPPPPPPKRKTGRPQGSKTRFSSKSLANAARIGLEPHEVLRLAMCWHTLRFETEMRKGKKKNWDKAASYLKDAVAAAVSAAPYYKAKFSPLKPDASEIPYDISRLTDGQIATLLLRLDRGLAPDTRAIEGRATEAGRKPK